MSNSSSNHDKSVWDGIMLIAAYHFLLAIISLLGSAAIFVFAIIPGNKVTTNPQSVFFPIIGAIVCLILCIVYGVLGMGLIRLKNSARMGAVFMAIFGTIGGLFGMIGAGIPVFNSLSPDWGAIAGIGVTGMCSYFLMTICDILVLFFLFSKRARAAFYGEEYVPEPTNTSIGHRVRTVLLGESWEPETVELAAPMASTNTPTISPVGTAHRENLHAPSRREPSAIPPSNDMDLDAPGSLFTEPPPRKK